MTIKHMIGVALIIFPIVLLLCAVMEAWIHDRGWRGIRQDLEEVLGIIVLFGGFLLYLCIILWCLIS